MAVAVGDSVGACVGVGVEVSVGVGVAVDVDVSAGVVVGVDVSVGVLVGVTTPGGVKSTARRGGKGPSLVEKPLQAESAPDCSGPRSIMPWLS